MVWGRRRRWRERGFARDGYHWREWVLGRRGIVGRRGVISYTGAPLTYMATFGLPRITYHRLEGQPRSRSHHERMTGTCCRGRQICFSKRPPSWTSFPDKPRLRLRVACRATSGPQFPRLQSERINRKSQAVAVARAGLSGSAYWLPAIGLEFCHVQYDSRENFLSWKEILYSILQPFSTSK
jgi:hypothetical protein